MQGLFFAIAIIAYLCYNLYSSLILRIWRKKYLLKNDPRCVRNMMHKPDLNIFYSSIFGEMRVWVYE